MYMSIVWCFKASPSTMKFVGCSWTIGLCFMCYMWYPVDVPYQIHLLFVDCCQTASPLVQFAAHVRCALLLDSVLSVQRRNASSSTNKEELRLILSP